MFINAHPEHLLVHAHEIHRARVAAAETHRWFRALRRRVRGAPLPATAGPPDLALAA